MTQVFLIVMVDADMDRIDILDCTVSRRAAVAKMQRVSTGVEEESVEVVSLHINEVAWSSGFFTY